MRIELKVESMIERKIISFMNFLKTKPNSKGLLSPIDFISF